MGKLTKQEYKLHMQAFELVDLKRDLTIDERVFVCENWDPASCGNIAQNSAFFTPLELAESMCIELMHGNRKVIDLCAGIGSLSLAALKFCTWTDKPEIVCVEQNSDYVAVGRRVVPEATWICGSVYSVCEELLDKKKVPTHYDEFISNPPFGAVARGIDTQSLKFSSNQWEYRVAEIGMSVCDTGTMIVASNIVPWAFSGVPCFKEVECEKHDKWSANSGLRFAPNCGIDTSFAKFKRTAVKVEIVNVEKTDGSDD